MLYANQTPSILIKNKYNLLFNTYFFPYVNSGCAIFFSGVLMRVSIILQPKYFYK